MTSDVSMEAEQAVLGAVLSDPEALAQVAIRPEIFGNPLHQRVAQAIEALAAAGKPTDPVLVIQHLEATGELARLIFGLGRAIGSTGNLQHYVGVLEDLWARREARRVAAEMLRSDLDCSGAEYVTRFAERLSAIETKQAKPARRVAEVMFKRLERREQLQKHPEMLRAWPSGLVALDALTGGFKPGHLFTVAARPGVGKTAFLVSVAKNLAASGVPVGIFVLEDYSDALADRLLMREGGIPSTLMRDGTPWDRKTWDRASHAVNAAADWPIFVDDQHGRTINEIAGAMRCMAREHGVRIFFLDNLAEVAIDRQDRSDERLDRALGRISKTFRDTARALDAAPVLVVHLNRDVEKADRKPRMSDLKNSGEIEDASHVLVMLSREQDSSALTADVVKNRNGPVGEAALYFNAAQMSVENTLSPSPFLRSNSAFTPSP